MKNYYRDAIDSIIDANPHFETIEDKDTPHIIGPFTNWKYCEMRPVIPFCLETDPNPPDFLSMAVEKKLISPQCLPSDPRHSPPNHYELKRLEKFKEEYYTENW